MWQGVLLLSVVGMTSTVAALIVTANRGECGGHFARAIRLVLELAGVSTIFLAGNLLLGLAIVLTLRSVSSLFVSVYVLNDLSLIVLSGLQGAIFFFWWRVRVG